jgi:tRNA threonylcarbamoyladenosine biosynthesis protein TsaB
MAWNLRGSRELLCPVLNSRRGEIYWALFQWRGRDGLDRLTPEQAGRAETLGQHLNGPVVLYGEGWETEKSAIQAMGRSATIIEVPEHMRPSAASIGFAGMRRLARGERAGMGIGPLYVQRPEAEIRYEESGGVSPVARRHAKVASKLKHRPARTGTRTRRKA